MRTTKRNPWEVSTHSRPKAAGINPHKLNRTTRGFNSQPPEGGWVIIWILLCIFIGFNSQPPEGGWQ